MKPLKIIFAGTPDFAATCLKPLLESEHQVVAVYTQPDRKSGRGKKVSMSPVKALALEANLMRQGQEQDIAVEQPINFKEKSDRDILAKYDADLMVVVAYGLLLPQAVLDTPKLGCINVHGSLLPRWRGAAPIQRAIEAGDNESGITIMQMEAGLDTGPMLLKATTEITPEETGASLHDKLAEQGADLLIQALDNIAEEGLTPKIQDDSLATYAHKLSKAEAQIDWTKPAAELERQVRAFNSWPIAFSTIAGQTVRVWQASLASIESDKTAGTILTADKQGIVVACEEGALILTKLQLAGSRAMAVQDLLNSPTRQELFAVGKQFDLPALADNK